MADDPLILSMSGLRTAGTLSGRTPTQLSPMYAPGPDDDADGLEELRRLGLVDGGHLVPGPALDTFAALADPVSFAQVTVHETTVTAEHGVFFAAADRRPITLTTTEQGVLVRDPGPNERIADGLTQLFGLSVLGGSDLAGELAPGDALVFAALLDQFRRMMLHQLATDTALTPVSVATIRRVLERDDDNPQWLLNILRSRISEPPGADAIDVDAALSTLVGLGWAEVAGTQILLAGAAKEALGRLLLLRRGARVTAARETGDDATYVDFTGLSFGMHDILEIDDTDGRVRMELTSSARFVGGVAQLLLDADALGSARASAV